MNRLREMPTGGSKRDIFLLSTDYQTAGHGQKGTSWEADPGLNLLFSLRFSPQGITANRQFALSEALALSVIKGIALWIDKGVCVKWPNDIYYGDRKLCGMLLEHTLTGTHISRTLAGVGLNVNQPDFYGDAPNPVSLRQILGYPVDRNEVLSGMITAFDHYYRLLTDRTDGYEHLHRLYLERLYRRQGLHLYRDETGTFEAEITGISPLGMITLRRADGTQHDYAFKQVSFVLP